MATPITTTRWRAKDGSLHDSEALAEAHDRWRATEARKAEVRRLISDEVYSGHFYTVWHDLNEEQRASFLDELADLFVEKASVVAQALKDL